MINFVDNIILKDLKLNYASAVYGNVGDELVLPLDNFGFSSHLYNRRHIVCSGSVKIEWMVGGTVLGTYQVTSQEDINNLSVFPNKHQPCDCIKVTSLEPNTIHYCIVPLLPQLYTINDEQFDLIANQPFTLKRGRLYISNIDLNVNGNDNIALKPFACVFNEVTVVPSINGKIAGFYTT